jgi:release factor glutamine methyltransferase
VQHHLLTAASVLERAGVEDARLTAEVLLAKAIGRSRAGMLARLEDALDAAQAAYFQEWVARAADHEPLAYLTGEREFFGLALRITPDVLVPRPETELLVARALALLAGDGGWGKTEDGGRKTAEPPVFPGPSSSVVDIGTGSGAIAIALATHWPAARYTAVDVSADALSLAHENARRHGVDGRITFLTHDLLPDGAFDLICANLPYIPTRALNALSVARHEPRLALDGGDDGLTLIRRLLQQAPAGATLLLEIQYDQAARVCALAPDRACAIHRDLSGLDRLVELGPKV